MLEREDQLVQLSVHAQKHGFSRLIWLKDLDLLLRHEGGRLDWRLVEDVATREGVSASVWYALELAHTLLGTPLPGVAKRLAPRRLLKLLYAAVWPEQRIANLEGFLRRRAVQFHAAESWKGMLPSLILMGRRSVRARLLAGALLQRRSRSGV
jgi:putative nucleotidyltransferase-like protein